MKPIRAFFAIDLPEKIKTVLHHFIMELKKQYTHSSIHWCQSQNLHITLHYLPSLKIDDIDVLTQRVEIFLKNFSSFEIEFGGLELFPSPHQPHVFSIQVLPNVKLINITHLTGEGILATQYPVETRSFRGHITLARLPKTKEGEIILPKSLLKIEKMRVTEIILYENQRSASGSLYIPLKKIQLK